MNKKTKDYHYLELSMQNIIKSPILLVIFSLLEYLSIYSNLLLSTAQIMNKTISIENDPIFYLSPYNIMKKKVKSNRITPFAIIIITLVLNFMYQIVFSLLSEKFVNSTKWIVKRIKQIYINLYEIFIFRVLSIYFIDSIVFFILNIIHSFFEENCSRCVNCCFLIVFLVFLFIEIYFIANHIKKYSIFSYFHKFKGKLSNYPYEIGFSWFYSTSLLILKVLICIIANIRNFFPNEESTDVLFFFNRVLIFLFVTQFIFVMYYIHFDKDKYLYLQLSSVTLFNIIAYVFSGVSIVVRAVLSDKFIIFIYSFLFLVLVIIALLYGLFLKGYLLRRMNNSNNLVGILFFLISNDFNYEHFICKWILNHKLNCSNKICNICINISEKEEKSRKEIKEKTPLMSFKEFYTILWKEVQYEENKRKIPRTKEQIFYLEILELVSFIIREKTQNIQFYVFFYKLKMKYQNNNANYSINLLFIFDYVNKDCKDFTKTFDNYLQSEQLVQLITSFADNFENFLLYQNKTPLNVIKIAEKYNSLIKNPNVSEYLLRCSNEYNYLLIILRFIYETLTKIPLSSGHDFFDITLYSEFIDYHYKNDKIILLKFSLEERMTILLKAGGVLKKYRNKPFEVIFPEELKYFGISKFIELINMNNFKDTNNVFEFVMRAESDNQNYVESFKMKFVTFPTIEANELIISGDYSNSYDEVLILEDRTHNDIIHSYSCGLAPFFGVSPSMIRSLKSNGKVFPFKTYFKKAKSKSSIAKKNLCFIFQQSAYKLHLLDYIDSGEELTDEQSKTINHFLRMKHEFTSNPLKFFKKFVIEHDKVNYQIFFITKPHKDPTVIKPINDAELFTTQIPNHLNQANTYNYSAQFDNISVSCSSTSSLHNNSFATRAKIKKVSKIAKTNVQTINTFVHLIEIFCLSLIIINLIFLSVEMIENNKFQRIFYLFHTFHAFKRTVETQCLRLFSNLCFDLHLNWKCVNTYRVYSMTYANYFPAMKDMPLISDIIYYEFIESMDTIQSSFLSFQNDLYQLNIKELNQIYNYSSIVYSLEADSKGRIKGIPYYHNLFEAVNIFNNYFTQIINSGSLRSTPIRFISFTSMDHVIDPSIVTMDELTTNQKNIYSIVVNYPWIQTILLYSETVIHDGFEKYLHIIENLIFAISLVLLVFHVILYIICFQFLKEFKTIIHHNYCKIIEIITSSSYLSSTTVIFSTIKKLIRLYEEKPLSLISKIMREKEDYKKAKEQQAKIILQQTSNEHTPIVQTHKKKKDTLAIYEPIVKNYNRILNYVFSAYFIYELIILFVILSMHAQLIYLVDYTSINSMLDNCVYGNLNAMQYVLLINASSSVISRMIYNATEDYITEGVNVHFDYIDKYKDFTNKHSRFNGISEVLKVNCDSIEIYVDEESLMIGEKYNIDMKVFFKKFCLTSGLVDYEDDLLIQKDVGYLLLKIMQFDYIVPYNKKVLFFYQREVYVLNNLVLLLNRLFSSYINDKINPKLVNDITNEFKIVIAICLALNCVFEVVIVILLIVFVMRRMIKLNRILTKLMKFLD